MSKTYEAAIQDLEGSVITYSAPPDFDGTISLSVKDGKVQIKFNSDFVEQYERNLLAQANPGH